MRQLSRERIGNTLHGLDEIVGEIAEFREETIWRLRMGASTFLG